MSSEIHAFHIIFRGLPKWCSYYYRIMLLILYRHHIDTQLTFSRHYTDILPIQSDSLKKLHEYKSNHLNEHPSKNLLTFKVYKVKHWVKIVWVYLSVVGILDQLFDPILYDVNLKYWKLCVKMFVWDDFVILSNFSRSIWWYQWKSVKGRRNIDLVSVKLY